MALTSFHKNHVLLKKTKSKNTQTLAIENPVSDPRKSCFGLPGVREPPIENHCVKTTGFTLFFQPNSN